MVGNSSNGRAMPNTTYFWHSSNEQKKKKKFGTVFRAFSPVQITGRSFARGLYLLQKSLKGPRLGLGKGVELDGVHA